jgi:hypothetical protein
MIKKFPQLRSRLIRLIPSLLALLLVVVSVPAQDRTLAERLGYPRDAKLVIVHADDLGMSHSVNAATVKAFQTGLVNSGSIMVPRQPAGGSWPAPYTYERMDPLPLGSGDAARSRSFITG